MDAGDHPPISPMRAAARGSIRGGAAAWGLYDAIVRHFLATLLPACSADQLTLQAAAAGERYELTWHRVGERGWLHALPHRRDGLGLIEGIDASMDVVKQGETLCSYIYTCIYTCIYTYTWTWSSKVRCSAWREGRAKQASKQVSK